MAAALDTSALRSGSLVTSAKGAKHVTLTTANENPVTWTPPGSYRVIFPPKPYVEVATRVSLTLAAGDLEATLANARVASDKLARTADGLDRLLDQHGGGLGKTAGASVAELQQLMIDARSASSEIRDLARTLRERPSSVLFEPKAAGVEIPR
jgi:hypothetical protein